VIDETLVPYASMTDSVRLADGRRIHIVCMGQGSPTVILTAGSGGWGVDWRKVQPQIAAKTRVCTWDRAGFGLSDPSPLPQTLANRVSDLEAALTRGGIAGPYVVVGHSMGGYESVMLKDRQPAKVVGMVLVDPSVPDQNARFARVAPVMTAAFSGSMRDPLATLFRKCIPAIRAGTVSRAGPDPDGCLHPPPPPPDYPEALRAAFVAQTTAPPETVARAMETMASSIESFDADQQAILSPRRNYGSMPLIVLTAGEFITPPDFPQAMKDEVPARQAEWARAHDEYAALSTRGVNRTVSGAGHFIQNDRPQAVIDAVGEVVDAARAARK
jgi:pimeloyl-ACP methyl ester carboxylesterase